MLPDRVSNQGPLTHESGALPTALRGPAIGVWWCTVFRYLPYMFGHLGNYIHSSLYLY